MAQTPQQFIEKYSKWGFIVVFVLWMGGCVRNCNRNMGTKITEKEYKHTIDSLTKKCDILSKENEKQELQINQLTEKLDFANKVGNDFRTLAEQATKRNTTIINNIQKDSINKK